MQEAPKLCAIIPSRCHRQDTPIRADRAELWNEKERTHEIFTPPNRSGARYSDFSFATAGAAYAEGAHVHGEAQAAIVIEGPSLSISLTSAMYNIKGFERAPETDEESQVFADAVATISDASAMFVINEEAGCEVTSVEHNLNQDGDHSDAAEVHDHDGHDHHDGHEKAGYRDLDAEYVLECEAAERLESIDMLAFGHFERLEKIDAVIIGPGGQTATDLVPGKTVITLNK